ncbi:MAG: hypothetical protein WA734_19385 [Candidatus Acidiferrales bacterium]
MTSFKGEPPDYVKALEQHEAYCAALEQCGLEVVRLAADLAHPDSTFVEDVAVLTRDTAILTRPGAKSREGEVDGIRDALGEFFQTVHEIEALGTLMAATFAKRGSIFSSVFRGGRMKRGRGSLRLFSRIRASRLRLWICAQW